MQLTSYISLTDIVLSKVNDNVPLRVITTCYDNENQGEIEDGMEMDENISVFVNLNFQSITPKLVNKILKKSSISVINVFDLNVFYEIVKKDYDGLINYGYYIIDGLILCISELFTKFISKIKVDYDKFNFRLVYLIIIKLMKMKEKEKDCRIEINENESVWERVDQIYLPCSSESTYDRLVEYLSKSSNETLNMRKEMVWGTDEFICLSDILEKFNIKKG